MEKDAKIYVSGHRGMVGSAVVRKLQEKGFTNIITRTHAELDLERQDKVEEFFAKERPEYVFLSAAAVGGIKKNIELMADMLLINLKIQNNVIENSYKYGVKRLMFFGTSCIYPRLCHQPMKEEYLLTGPFEPTNEGYAIAKVAGLKLCEYYNKQYGTDYLSIMPCNLYGINDHYNENGHVLPSLIHRFHQAKINNDKSIAIWGSGMQRREFLFGDDMAEAAVFLMENYHGDTFVNVGSGTDVSIKELAYIIADVIGYRGEIVFDTSKPDGMPQKLMDVSLANSLGWHSKIELKEGIRIAYEDYLNKSESVAQ